MAENKTQKTTASVSDFINSVPDEKKRQDGFTLLEIFKQATGEEPAMWGPSIIGFGDTRYQSPTTGRSGDWFKVGFSPRKQALTLYMLNRDKNAALFENLGKYKTGGGCIYINKLSDVKLDILKEIIANSLT